MIGLPEYARIKDKYCLCYTGLSDEHLLQLKSAKSLLEAQFHGLRIFIACHDEKYHLISDCQDSLTLTQLAENTYGFAHIRVLDSENDSLNDGTWLNKHVL